MVHRHGPGSGTAPGGVRVVNEGVRELIAPARGAALGWCHAGGRRPHATAEHSGNVAALALISWGESWHNNHHAQPTSARFGASWRQPDIGWWVVRVFVALGWARLR